MPITHDIETDIRFLQGIEKKEIEDVKGRVQDKFLICLVLTTLDVAEQRSS